MNKRKKEYQKYLLGKELLFTFVIVESKDGYILVPRNEGKDCHLTIYVKDDKIMSHTTIVNGEKREYTNHTEITKTDFVKGILDQFKNNVKSYRKKQKCMTLSDEFKEAVFQKSGIFTQEVDFLKLSSLNNDIEILKENIIKKIKIAELYGDSFPIGFNKKRILVPINNKQMLELHESTFQNTFDFILESLGIKNYYEQFFNTSEGKKILTNIQMLIDDSTFLDDIKNEE